MNLKLKNTAILPWLMWALAATYFFYSYLVQVSPGIMVKELISSFNINATILGGLAALYFYACAAMQIPIGVLIDRLGARRLLAASALLCSIGAMLFAVSNIFWIAGVGRLLMGIGAAADYLGCVYIAATWLSPKLFTITNSIVVSIAMLGAISGQTPLAILVHHFGWRPVILLLSIIGLVLACLFWLIVRDHPNQHPIIKEDLWYGLRHVIKSKQTWLCSIYGGFMFAPIVVLGTLWGTPFLAAKFQISTPGAATMVAMIYLGFACGSPLLCSWSDYVSKRKIFILIGTCCALVSLGLIIYSHTSLLLSKILFFIYGFASSVFVLAFSVVKEINPPFVVGAAMGFMNSFNMLIPALLPPIIGGILDWRIIMGNQHTSHVFTTTDFQIALLLLPIVVLAALCLVPLIKEG